MLRRLVLCACAAFLSASSADAAYISCHPYGSGHGRMASPGTPNPQGLPIVAHKKLPFGTKVRFYNAHASVDAIVKDRGPFYGAREYDLDCKAMRVLGINGVGHVNTKIIGR